MTRRSLVSLVHTGLAHTMALAAKRVARSGNAPCTRFAIVNQCAVVNEISEEVVAAIQKQLDEHFFPAWG